MVVLSSAACHTIKGAVSSAKIKLSGQPKGLFFLPLFFLTLYCRLLLTQIFCAIECI